MESGTRLRLSRLISKDKSLREDHNVSIESKGVSSPDSAEDARKRLSRLVEKVSNDAAISVVKSNDVSAAVPVRRTLLDFENRTTSNQIQRARSASPTATHDFVTNRKQIEKLAKHEIELIQEEYLQKESVLERKWHEELLNCQNSLIQAKVDTEKAMIEREYINSSKDALMMLVKTNISKKRDLPKVTDVISCLFDSYKVLENGPMALANKMDISAAIQNRTYQNSRLWFFLLDDSSELSYKRLLMMFNKFGDKNFHNNYSIAHESLDYNHPMINLLSSSSYQQPQQIDDSATISWLLSRYSSANLENDNILSSRTVSKSFLPLLFMTFPLCPMHYQAEFPQHHYSHKVKCVFVVEQKDNIEQQLQQQHMRDVVEIVQDICYQSIMQQDKQFQENIQFSALSQSTWLGRGNSNENTKFNHSAVELVKSLEEWFANVINVQYVNLLLSIDVMKTLGIHLGYDNDYLLFKLNAFDKNDFQPIPDFKQQQAEYPWYKDLQEGKIVIFNPSNSEIYPRQNTAIYYSSFHDTVQLSRLTLQSFLMSVDDKSKSITSSMIVPVKTPYGLLVFIVGERSETSVSLLDDVEVSIAPHYINLHKILPFTVSYANCVSASIGSLTSAVSSMIFSVAQLQNNVHSIERLERKLISTQKKCEMYLVSWDLSRSYQLKKHYYAMWKKIVDQTKTEKLMQKMKGLYEMFRDLMDFRNYGSSNTSNVTDRVFFSNQYVNHFDSFLKRVEYCFKKRFPLDYVILITSSSNVIENVAESLYGSGESFETLTQSIELHQLWGRICNISILLQRNTQQNGKLTESEKVNFMEYCSLINSVHVALNVGFQESNFVDFAYASLEHCESHLSELSLERNRNEIFNKQLENIRCELNAEITKNRDLTSEMSLLSLMISTFSDLAFFSDSQEQLSENVWKLVPQLLNCESALLVLNEVHRSSEVDSKFQKYKIMWPNNTRVLPIDFVSKSNQQMFLPSTKSDPQYLSLNQLMNIPQYELFGSGQEQSVIFLSGPKNEIFGAVLIFRNSEIGGFSQASTSISNQMLQRFVSSVLYPKIIAFRCAFLQEENFKLEKLNDSLRDNVKCKNVEVEELKTKAEGADRNYSDVVGRYETLHAKFVELQDLHEVSLTNLTSELNTKKQYYEKIIVDLNSTTKSLENNVHDCKIQCEEMKEHKNDVLEISEKFAYDDRCHQQKYVWYWLREIAQSRQAQFFYFCDKYSSAIHQTAFENSCSEFFFPEANYHDINGLFASIGESNRTGKYVHFKSVLSNSFLNLERSNTIFGGNVGSEIDILCVPNRALLDGASRSSSHPGCFLFFKHCDSNLWKGFSSQDCDILECACNLISRVLAKEPIVSLPEDYVEIKRLYQQTQLSKKILLDSIAFGKALLDKPLRSLNDLSSYIKDAISELCREEAFKSFLSDQSFYDSTLIMVSSSFEKRLKQFSGNSQEMITKAKSLKVLQHSGNLIVFPIVLLVDKVVGLVVIEKKIILSDNSSSDVKDGLPLQKFSISDIELEVFSILLCFVTYTLDKVNSMKDALQSIQEATFAVNAVESNRQISEDRLSAEISVRLQYEEVLKKGQELFSRVATKRTTISQLFESVRSSILTITAATDCFILLPYSATSLFHEVLLEIYSEMNPSDVNPWLEKINAGSGYYTLIPSEDIVLDVKLEKGDIEAVALSSNRAVFFPSKSAESNRLENYSIWQSWAIRTMQSNVSAQYSIPADEYHNLFSLVVPFSLHQKLSFEDPGGHLGLAGAIVVVRNDSPFLNSDRECIAHLNHILSCCFKIKQGVIQSQSKLMDIEKLQQELFSLKAFKRQQQMQYEDQITAADKIAQLDELSEILNSFCMALNLPPDSQTNNSDDPLSKHVNKYFEILFQKLFPLFKILSCTEVEWSDLRMKSGDLDNGRIEFRNEYTLQQLGTLIVKFGLLSKDNSSFTDRISKSSPQLQIMQSIENMHVCMVRLQFKSRINYFVAFSTEADFFHEKPSILVQESYLHLRFAYLVHCLELFSSFSKYYSEISRKLQTTLESTESMVATLKEEKNFAAEKETELEKKFSEFVKHEKSLIHEIAEKKREKFRRFEGIVVKLNMLQSSMLKEITDSREDTTDSFDILCRACVELGKVIECKVAIGKLKNPLPEKDIQQNARFQCEYIYNVHSISLPNWLLQKVAQYGSDKLNFIFATDRAPTKEQLSLDIFQGSSNIRFHIETTSDGSNIVGVYCPARGIADSTSFVIIFQIDSQLKPVHVCFSQCLQNLILIYYNLEGKNLMKDMEEKLINSKRKLQTMDQLTADWTELVKGLNSSSAAVVAGVKGFWARAANTIVSILSSNCLIRSCGLILQDNSKEKNLVELVVRDLSRPYYPLQNFPHSDESEIASVMEYAKANIEHRQARELGSKIHMMLLDIFDKHSTEQRIYKTVYDANPQLLSIQNEHNLVRMMYFVPVRTAYNIHGILRLNLEISFANNENTNDQSTILSSIENSMVNFAEVFAPLLITSRRMEEYRSKKELIEEENRDKHNQITDFISKMQQCQECNLLFSRIIEECSKLSCSRGTSTFHTFCEQLLICIKSILRGEVDLFIHPELMEGFQIDQNLANSSTGDGATKFVGNKSYEFSTRKSKVHVHANDSEEVNLTSILILPSGEIAGKVIVFFDDALQRRKLESIFPAISQFLTAILREAVAEQSAKDKVVLAVDSLKTMKETLELEQLRFSSLVDSTEHLKIQLQEQIEWTKFSSDSLKYVTSIENHSYRLPALQNMASYSLSSFSHLFDYVLSTLSSLGCTLFPHVCFNVAVINNNARNDLRATESGQDLIWLHGEREDGLLTWSKLSDSSKAVARNIVNLCLSQRIKSEIEIREPVRTTAESHLQESLRTIHVIGLPLWHSYTGTIIGALVILQYAEISNGLNDDYSKFYDVATVVSRVISHEIVEYIVEESYIHQEANLISRDAKIEELEKLVTAQQALFENQKESNSREISHMKSKITNLKADVQKYDSLIASQLSKETSSKQEFKEVLLNFVNYVKTSNLNRGFTAINGDELFMRCYKTQGDYSGFIKQHIVNVLSTVEKSIENICERANRKRYHVSIVVRKERLVMSSSKIAFGDLADLIVFSTNNYSGEECLLISRSKLKTVSTQIDIISYLENCFRGSSKQVICGENLSQLSPTDLLGVNSSYFSGGDENADTVARIFCIGLKFSTNAPDMDAVIRIIFSEERSLSMHYGVEKLEYSQYLKQTECELQKLLISHTLEAYSSLSDMSLFAFQNFAALEEGARNQELVHVQEKDAIEDIKSIFSRYRKLYKVVCKESSTLLDPPVISGENSTARASHPANIAPIAALQDSCLKILSLLRNLLRSEGQAILLKDQATSPTTYQIIYSGNTLSWPGIEPNTFGVITSRAKNEFENSNQRTSLVETAVLGRKSLLVANAPLDNRYFSQIDGICGLGTPLLVCPLKGRNGIIIGAIVVAKSKDSLPFSIEDVAAAELIVGMGALSIYWCQGLGSMHHQLLKTVEKMERLEKSIVAK